MEPTYLVFSLRTAAWLSPVGNYTSDWKKAMKMSRSSAREICKQHMLNGKIVSIPVAEADLNDLG